MAHVDEAQQKA